ncbi:MAG: hypothetical protein K8L99_17985 [Anaerolineae bacterium]|nr:hypothetical protein [Anaerolineae bacterium]
MTNRKTLLLMLIVFVGLAALVLVQNNQEQPPLPTPQPDVSVTATTPGLLRVFPELSVLDIQAIRLERPDADQTLTLQRDSNGQWTSNSDIDPETATNIARTIVLMPYGNSINIVSTTDLSTYGFGETGHLLIQFVQMNGEGHGVIVGGVDPDYPVYYALVDERDEIFRIERGAVDFLDQFLD